MSGTTESRGRELLLSLIYPTAECDMTPTQLSAFDAAVAMQEEFMAGGDGRAVTRETVGDVSVTYAADCGTRVCGERISSAAMATLRCAALLDSWI